MDYLEIKREAECISIKSQKDGYLNLYGVRSIGQFPKNGLIPKRTKKREKNV